MTNSSSIGAAEAATLARLQYFLLDMDGTIYLGDKLLPGAREFVAYLEETGRRYLFFTNNSSADAETYSRKLSGMGIEAPVDSILTSGAATARYLVEVASCKRVFAVGTPSFEQELAEAGLQLDETAPEAVVISFDRTLTYAKLERACLLLQQGLAYYASNPDLVCPTPEGGVPDCGSIAALLKAATGRSPLYIGKPEPSMIAMGMARLEADPKLTAMVGDRLYTDMEMARRAEITGILLLSGEAHAGDLNTAMQQPQFVFPSVRELQQALASAD